MGSAKVEMTGVTNQFRNPHSKIVSNSMQYNRLNKSKKSQSKRTLRILSSSENNFKYLCLFVDRLRNFTNKNNNPNYK